MSAIAFENMLGSVYPITFSCYHAVFDVIETAMLYIGTFTTWQRVLYNVMHKFGELAH